MLNSTEHEISSAAVNEERKKSLSLECNFRQWTCKAIFMLNNVSMKYLLLINIKINRSLNSCSIELLQVISRKNVP